MTEPQIPDYGDDAAPSNDELAQVTSAIRALQRADEALEEAKADAAIKQQTRDDIAYRKLPDLLIRLGYEPGDKIKMGGRTLELKTDVKTSIPATRREEAYAWLEEHGHGGLIKRDVIVGFRRDEHEEANALLGNLADYDNVKEVQKVESATLKKFVKGALADGEDVPTDLFTVYEFKEAKLK